MSVEDSNTSRSPSRKLRQSFSEQISDIKTKLVRALSAERSNPSHDGSSQYSKIGEDIKPADRSVSRGRDSLQSIGRGGLGNMRPSSTSRGPEDRVSQERGRGANRNLPNDSNGIDVVPEHSLPHSTGRGGYANITELGSVDIEPPVHIVHPEHELVSTGRGGVGNIRDRSQSKVRDQPEPHRKQPQEGELLFSSGRGGAGNIRSRSQSKAPKEEKAHDHKSGVESAFKKVIHPHA